MTAIFRYATMEDIEMFNSMYCSIRYSDIVEKTNTRKLLQEEKVKELIENESIIFMIVDSKVVGYSIVSAYEEYVKLEEMHILYEERKKGYGKQFLTYIEKEAMSLGIYKLTLFSVNMITDRIWEKLGFFYVEDTGYVKSLTSHH